VHKFARILHKDAEHVNAGKALYMASVQAAEIVGMRRRDFKRLCGLSF
jgi:hypothetical protein